MSNNNDLNENAEILSTDGGAGDFDEPPFSEASSSSDFDLPPVGNSDAAVIEQDSEMDPQLSAKVMQAKNIVEEKLCQAASSNAMSMAEMQSVDSAGIQGVGVSSTIPGQPSLLVYVEGEANEEQARRELFDTVSLEAAKDDSLPIEVVTTGLIEAYSSNRSRFRPAPAGASAGHYDITAGTIGGWARGRSGSRTRRLLMVSNNHVLANSNGGRFGDSIIQPGRADGGQNTADRIAILERYIAINFASGARNYVDAATGWCWPSRVRREHVYHGRGTTPRYFKVGNSTVEPAVNMLVGKTGRTTDLTQGRIQAVNVSVNVNFGAAGVAHFRDQFAVRSTGSNTFSAGGDSGSFVWQWRSGLPPVGLLFAGGGGTTFCNRMSRVLTALDINLFELT